MKILFLDIDGVLNSTQYFNSLTDQKTGKWIINIKEDYFQIDKGAISLLNQLIVQINPKIVISSTWRLNYSINQLKELFASCDFKGEIIDITPEFNFKSYDPCYGRSTEIAQWLINNKDLNIEKFAILDDSSHAGIGFDSHFVKTKFHSGLQQKHILKLIEILK